ncbi:hypothetical protein ACFOY4_00910 [Actinomadura syzygii]|uniref:Uncharacterized protein n=1 Tax=Actinomadura syzygii TaxID=1427538 RepID=A0A5D0TUZ8_9ACTN|nr:hypothetical protein [Actinomadura syzygii]TYC08679.1 hypothetical protein FXF65_38000 [Actinomadura syzygii]
MVGNASTDGSARIATDYGADVVFPAAPAPPAAPGCRPRTASVGCAMNADASPDPVEPPLLVAELDRLTAADDGRELVLPRPDARPLLDEPVSCPNTGPRQPARLHPDRLTAAVMPVPGDMDTPHAAEAVAEQVPRGRFTAAVCVLGSRSAKGNVSA